ncbi:MAG: TldD/PmbA family protein, partial [Alphaproteobacteria bacterium]|nr:TldD/PmbA family protein [Alphaproteobacteria bacterium]
VPEDAFSGLAPEDLLLRGAPPALDLCDATNPSPEALRDAALRAEAAAQAVKGVTNTDSASASAAHSRTALVTSHGFAGCADSSSFGITASVIAGTGSAMQRDYGWHTARHHADLSSAEAIGALAGERATARLGAAPITGGAMPVVFDPRVGSGLLGHLIGALSGAAIAAKTSFLKDALGTSLFGPDIVITDDPHRLRGLGSRSYDGEGLPTKPLNIIDQGNLTSFLIDSTAARQLGCAPTGHATRGGGVSSSNLALEPGQATPAELMADIKQGLYVIELIGQGVNLLTGDYSRGAAGFLIENGVITRPVNQVTVAGNLRDMFRALIPADDLVYRYATNAPTLRIDGMTVAGS